MKDYRNSKVGYLDDLKILIVMPTLTFYGMEWGNLQIMKMLKERGANILFVIDQMSGDRLRREIEKRGCKWITVDSGKIDKLFLNPINLFKTLFNIFSASISINRIYKEYNPTHIYITDLSHFIRSFITVLTTKNKVIFRLPNPPNVKLSGIKALISKFIWRYYVSNYADVIVCNSIYTSRELKSIGVEHENVKIIYNRFPERVLEKKADFNFIISNRINVVYLGRMTYDKGVGDLYEAAKKIVNEYEDVDFYFAGDYKQKNKTTVNLENQIKRENLGGRINLLGEIEDVFGLLSKCHLHVCPSNFEHESLPNVILEAKFSSLPSVVYPNAGLPEAVEHLKDGYICNDKSVMELYNGIKYFINNRKVLRTAGKEAKKSLERFSHEKILEQWYEVFS